MTSEARKGVTELLKSHPDYADILARDTTPAGEQRDREAFLISATWPDIVRTPNTPRSKYHHAVWHYCDFPFVVGDIGKAIPQPETQWKSGTDPANAVQAFAKNLADLRNSAAAPVDRAIAISWIEHLIGDIHQPLHATSLYSTTFPTGDKGGNSIIVRIPDVPGGRTEGPINLHSLWDGLLGNYSAMPPVENEAERLMRKYGRRDFPELVVTDFEQWARKSQSLATTTVYLEGSLEFVSSDSWNRNKQQAVPELPPRYMANAISLAEERAALAGLRLADTLNAAFAAATTAPTTQPQ
jgi:hypothetical protein